MLAPGHTYRGAGYWYFNLVTLRFIDENEALVVLSGMLLCLPAEHTVGWDNIEVVEDLYVSNANLVRLQTGLYGWGEEDDDNKDIADVVG